MQTALSLPAGQRRRADEAGCRDGARGSLARGGDRGAAPAGAQLPEQLTDVYVVDRKNVLRGVLPLARLLFGDRRSRSAEAMDADPVHFCDDRCAPTKQRRLSSVTT